MAQQMNCLRCGASMRNIGIETIQLGQAGWILGDLSNLIAGAMEVNIWMCPACGKLEFYSTAVASEALPQKTCPHCGKAHDFDFPKCPFCGFDYYA